MRKIEILLIIICLILAYFMATLTILDKVIKNNNLKPSFKEKINFIKNFYRLSFFKKVLFKENVEDYILNKITNIKIIKASGVITRGREEIIPITNLKTLGSCAIFSFVLANTGISNTSIPFSNNTFSQKQQENRVVFEIKTKGLRKDGN